MSEVYEIIEMKDGSPIKAIISNVNRLKMHWHDEFEILFILKGSIELRLEDESYILNEEDVVVINSKEAHSTSKLDEDNIVLALQIQSNYYRKYYPLFADMKFNCNSAGAKEEDGEKFQYVRHFLAKIIYGLNKKVEGYELQLNSHINQLSFYLMNNFQYHIMDRKKTDGINRDRQRIENIINHINSNLEQRITLNSIAKMENINPYYLSHFFKEKLGISFQDYINTIRMQKALGILVGTNDTITDIALSCGFSSTNYFNKLFRQTYKTTPTKYRKKHGDENKKKSGLNIINKRSKSYFDVDRTTALERLFKYLDPPNSNIYLENQARRERPRENLTIDMAKKTREKYDQHWRKLINFGRAAEGLRANLQGQIREIQREIPFDHVRFHGIFNDEMMIYQLDEKGIAHYNWTYVDQLFDFLLEVNLKPFIELGLMPSCLRSTDHTIFWWKGNISPPKDMKLWVDLVKEFIKHCINRYGLEEVKSWYFEVWNEPELEYVFWAGSREEYFKFFKATVLGARSILKDIKISGPGISHGTYNNSSWLRDFLEYVKKEDLDLDFISLHIYPEYVVDEEADEKTNFQDLKSIYYGEDHVKETIEAIDKLIQDILGKRKDIYITEWNGSALSGNLIHDTSYIASYIVKNSLDSIKKIRSLGYWTLSDLMEEEELRPAHYHGGFGLINKDGIKKSSYYAYYLLNKLGPIILDRGEEYIITENKEGHIQILLYNFSYFDDLFISGDSSLLNQINRYNIYKEKGNRNIDIEIKGLRGKYKETSYELNRNHGSSFDNWVKMGANEDMTRDEISYLRGISRPKMEVKNLLLDGQYESSRQLPSHGILLINLEKIL